MKKIMYRNIYSNKTIKNVGQQYSYLNYEFNNKCSCQRVKSKLSYKYCENIKLKLERIRPMCSMCGIKCGNPELSDNFFDYKKKSKKKGKGCNKRNRYLEIDQTF